MTLHEDLIEKAKRLGSMTTLNTQQAAAILGMTEDALEKRREPNRQNPGSETEIPFHPRGSRVVYYLVEVLKVASRGPFGLPEPFKILAILMGEEFCNEIGLPYPKNTVQGIRQAPRSTIKLPSSSLANMVAGMAGDNTNSEEKKRGPKSLKPMYKEKSELEAAGVHVQIHRCEFGSLNDFLRNAEPDEEWLFACPPYERPFDFVDALLEGSEAPFFWLSLSDYLERLRTAAINDRDKRLAEEERDLLSSELKT